MRITPILRPGLFRQSRRNAGIVAAVMVGALSACGSGGTDPADTGISKGEARALDEAAEMLDEKRLPDDAIPPIDGEDQAADAPADNTSE